MLNNLSWKITRANYPIGKQWKIEVGFGLINKPLTKKPFNFIKKSVIIITTITQRTFELAMNIIYFL